ncbi:hypothetical protein TNCV_2366101 [Trichonephila clavipes]|nr:hypothetical protein TNCV_2366101 [Trichonephila clavipes]
MYRNPVTSQYILDFKKCPIEVYLQVDDHVHPGNCLAAVSSEKTRPSSYGVLPSPAELGYERTDVVFFSFSDEWSRDLKSVQGNPTMNLEAKWNDNKKGEISIVVGVSLAIWKEKEPDKFSSRKNFDKVGSLDSSGVKQGCAASEAAHGRRIYKETGHQMLLLFSKRRDVTALALSYGTFPLRKV